jgi:hypothetical protein
VFGEVVVAGPFEELELSNELRLEPATVGHLGLREALAPATALRFGEIDEGQSLICTPSTDAHRGELDERPRIGDLPMRRDLSGLNREDVSHPERHFLPVSFDAECVEIVSDRSVDRSERRHTVTRPQYLLDRRRDIWDRGDDASPPPAQFVSAAWVGVRTVLNEIRREEFVDSVQLMF